MVEGVVAVRRRGEDGAEQQARAAESDGVVEPSHQGAQAGPGVGLRLVDRRPAESQGVDVPPDRVFNPAHV